MRVNVDLKTEVEATEIITKRIDECFLYTILYAGKHVQRQAACARHIENNNIGKFCYQ